MKKILANVQIKEYYLVVSLVAVSLIIRLYYAWKPVVWLIDKGLSDDAFYYFQIARNIALGNGVTFDGLAPTNGFHPLYMVILVPIFLLVPDNLDTSINLALTIVMSFSVLTAFPIYQLVKLVISRNAAFIALIAWLFNPWVYLITLTAVESAIYIFFISLVSLFYVVYQGEGSINASLKWPAILGFMLGLVILSRTDGVFMFLAILLDILLVPGSLQNFWQSITEKKKLRHMIVLTLSCGLLLSPWIGWNIATFGTVFQVSGAAVLHTNHYGIGFDFFSTSNAILKSSLYSLVSISLLSFQVIFLFLIVEIFRNVPRYKRYSEQPLKHPSLIKRPLRFISFYGVFWFMFYSWVFWGRQAWYYMPVLFIATIIAGILYYYFNYSVKSSTIGSKSLIVVTSFFIVTFIIGFFIWRNHDFSIYPLQRNGYRLAEWLSSETEQNARIGAWNSGMLGYYADRTVINLDGVVNNSLYTYVREREISVYDVLGLYEYIQNNQIDYITDYESFLTNYYLNNIRIDFLELFHEFPSVDGKYDVRVYRVVN